MNTTAEDLQKAFSREYHGDDAVIEPAERSEEKATTARPVAKTLANLALSLLMVTSIAAATLAVWPAALSFVAGIEFSVFSANVSLAFLSTLSLPLAAVTGASIITATGAAAVGALALMGKGLSAASNWLTSHFAKSSTETNVTPTEEAVIVSSTACAIDGLNHEGAPTPVASKEATPLASPRTPVAPAPAATPEVTPPVSPSTSVADDEAARPSTSI